MYFRKKTSGGRAYLQIVESHRDGAQVRQQVIATLGRVEDLRESGQLERLLRSGVRFAAKAIVVDALNDGTAISADVRRIGPGLVFERLWEETGCRSVIEKLAGERKHGFALERAVFLTVLHRLFAGGSDRAADRWREDYRIDGVEGLELHHLYRAMAWLGEELPAAEQDGRTPFAPRCLKDVVEERLFERRRDLFTKLDLVFMDTTSLYFEGAGGQTLGRHGYSKGSSAGPAPDDSCRTARRRWPAGVHRDVARQHGGYGQPGSGGGPSAPTLLHQSRLHRRRPRHDQCRDHRGTRSAGAALHSRRRRWRSPGGATSSAAITRKPRKMPPTAPRFSPRWSGNSRRATRRWSAMAAIAVSWRPLARTASSSIAPRPRRTPGSTASSCCAPTPTSPRSMPCFATSS